IGGDSHFPSPSSSPPMNQAPLNQRFRIFKAHSAILRARCPFFEAALSSEWVKKEGSLMIIKKPNIEPRTFDIVLTYIYNGTASLHEIPPVEIMKLLICSDELALEELITHTQEFLIKNHQQWIQSNVLSILEQVFDHSSFRLLQSYCMELLISTPSLLTQNPKEFLNIEEGLLFELLERDDFDKMKEIEIWDLVLGWGVGNCVGLCDSVCGDDADDVNDTGDDKIKNGRTKDINNHNVENWTDSETQEIARKISNLVYHIRFSAISFQDFSSKIKPFSKLFPVALWNDIQDYYHSSNYLNAASLLPPRRRFDSNILSQEHLEMLSDWIDLKDDFSPLVFPNDDTPYQFNLLYRASDESFNLKTLHERIDYVPNIIVVSKVSGSTEEEIVGGYNPIGWGDSGEFNPDIAYSFLFSFKTREDQTFGKISRIKRAMLDKVKFDSKIGLVCFGSSDLRIGGILRQQSGYTQLKYYESKIRDFQGTFDIDDYEIFQ
ncbi:8511_t:CDS:2, partial [Acaulospora morrowiae]